MRAVGSALPLADATVDAAWSLGVLCTTPTSSSCSRNCAEQVRSPGRIALLAFVARQSVSDEQPEGNHFPSVDRLTQLVNDAGLRIHAWQSTADVPAIPQDWTRRVDAATDALAERHGTSPDVAVGRTPKQADR